MMQQAIKRFIGVLITVMLLIAVIHYLGKLVRPNGTDITIKAIETFHNMPEDTIEVIGYGSSRMWKGLNVMEMYEQYGIGAYNYGCNWQHLNTTLLFLEDSLRTQSPKVVLIETSRVDKILKNTNITGEIYYTREISDFEGKRKYLKQCFGNDIERYVSYYVPLCAFHDNWTNLKKKSFQEVSTKKDFYNTMGFSTNTDVVPVKLGNPAEFKQKKLSEDSLTVLDRMVEICKENNIEIVFFTIPWKGKFAYSDAMTTYAEENGCQYLNLFEMLDEVGIDENTDFQDTGHLNTSGATKVADFMGEFIVNNYDVTDMRTVEENIWDNNLSESKRME